MKFKCTICGDIKYMYKSHVKKDVNDYVCKICIGKQKKGVPKQKYDKSLNILLEHYRKKFNIIKEI